MSEIKELIDGYIEERDIARNTAAFYQQQAAQWQSLATAMALAERLATGLSGNWTISIESMEEAALWGLEPKQLEHRLGVKLILTLIEEDSDEGSSLA